MRPTTHPYNTYRKQANAFGLRNAEAEQTALALHEWDTEMYAERCRVQWERLTKAQTAEAQAVAAKVQELDAQYRDELRAGYGVAWVHGYDMAPRYASGEGMSIHLGKAKVSVIPKRRGVVVMRNHKFCWLQIV